MTDRSRRQAGELYVPPVSLRRPTFDVVLWRKPLVMAICYEGYSPTDDTVEPAVFDMFDVQVHPGNEPGTGTRVVRAAIEAARQRGFAIGRSFLLNPRMVTIMAKLQREDLVGDLRFLPSSSAPTEELMGLEDFLGVPEAAAYLNQPFDPAAGMYSLDCVYRIQ